jgi:hypothetical protein
MSYNKCYPESPKYIKQPKEKELPQPQRVTHHHQHKPYLTAKPEKVWPEVWKKVASGSEEI